MNMDWRPPESNKQCLVCHKIYGGESEGVNPGKRLQHISHPPGGEPVYLEAGTPEHPSNVSHGLCGPECLAKEQERQRQLHDENEREGRDQAFWEAKAAQEREETRRLAEEQRQQRQQEREAQQQKRRFRRGRK